MYVSAVRRDEFHGLSDCGADAIEPLFLRLRFGKGSNVQLAIVMNLLMVVTLFNSSLVVRRCQNYYYQSLELL